LVFVDENHRISRGEQQAKLGDGQELDHQRQHIVMADGHQVILDPSEAVVVVDLPVSYAADLVEPISPFLDLGNDEAHP
jgi:hypothetical protein